MTRRVRYREASELLGVPEGTLRALVCQKRVPHIRLSPRMVVFDPLALEEWLRARTVAVQP